MFDPGQIEGFDWDEGNGRKSLDRHGVSREEAEQIFVDARLLILADEKQSKDEDRFQAYGMTGPGRLLHVSFTLRRQAALIRVISARDMSRRERARYE